MKPTTQPIPTAAPQRAADPVYAVLSAEREAVKAAFEQTKLAALFKVNHEALHAWIAGENAETLKALVAADRALEAETLADPDAARLYTRLCALNRQLKAHRNALGLN